MFELNGVKIGKGHKPFIIAELSANHGGDLHRAKDSIYAAKSSGADAVKIQTYSKGRISRKTRTSRYFEETLAQEESIAEFLDNIIFNYLSTP